jgi:hypothetical protein
MQRLGVTVSVDVKPGTDSFFEPVPGQIIFVASSAAGQPVPL